MKVVIFLYSKLLKLLKTDANTLVSYILTLLSIYFCVDRLVEIVLLVSKGLGIAYWNPFMYTFAMACPVFGFLFICESSFNKYRESKGQTSKLHFLYFFTVVFTIILTSMVMQYINLIGWLIVTAFKNFPYVAKVFPELFKPAFSALVVVIPLFLVYPMIDWFINTINDSPDSLRSIRDFTGLSLSSKSEATGPYTCEVMMFRSTDKKKNVMIPEKKRFEGALFVGATGTGKTRTLIDPMVAFDMEKKYFFKEVGKQIAYNVLSLGLARLNAPYTNEFLNANFTMDMLVPVPEKMEEYKKYTKKLIHYCNKDNSVMVYKNLGVTLISVDPDSLTTLTQVAKNYNLKANIVDPMNPDSIGINPFSNRSIVETGILISKVLRILFDRGHDTADNFHISITQQAIENLSILLKLMYPKLNGGKLPTLEDLLQMLNNFDLVENMCEKLKEDPELAEKYSLQVSYFEKNFYKPPISTDGTESLSYIGSGRKETEGYLYHAATELDNILRHPGVRNILCNRTNNIDFDKMLSEGQVTLVSIVKGVLPFRALAFFFLMLYSSALYRRPGVEDALIGNFLYIDDMNLYMHKEVQPIFTYFRRYRCGLNICIHNLSELDNSSSKTFRDTVLSNCKTKVVFGDTSPEDTEYWVKEFGTTKKWTYSLDWTPGKEDISPTRKGAAWQEKAKFTQEKITQQAFRQVRYKTKNAKGKTERGSGETDFLAEKHKISHESKQLDFEKFILDVQSNGKKTTNYASSDTDYDPIMQDKADVSDPDKEDAITIPLEARRRKSKKDE